MSKPYEGRSSSVLSQRSKSIAQKSIPGFCVFLYDLRRFGMIICKRSKTRRSDFFPHVC